MNDQVAHVGRRFVLVGAVAILAGAAVAILNMMTWYYAQSSLALIGEARKLPLVSRFFLAQALATAVVVIGAYFVCRALFNKGNGEAASLGSIVSDAFASGRARKVGILAAVAYAAVYAFASSLVVFQPGVDFAQVYGVSSTSLSATVCCGNPGTTPSLIVFLLPRGHVALQLVPLNALFVVIVPLLVGFNFTVAAYSVRGPARRGGRWLSSIGVLAGLFTGCPTCAGYFLASAVGGLGASTLAVALAPFQMFFIAVSIPLLLASPLIVAAGIRTSLGAACAPGGSTGR